jgi:uncharacterized protein (TIGR02271 family)
VFHDIPMEGEIKLPEKQNSPHNHHEKVTLQLHKEEFQINKKWVETADVTIYKKTYTVEKQILVPVTYEELIIEEKVLTPEGAQDAQIETTCIPLKEERIEVILTPTILNDVEIYKKQIEEHIQVHETVKEEKVHIHALGDVKVLVDEPASLV